MGDDNRRAVALDRLPKDLTDADVGRIETAHVHGVGPQQPIAGIQVQHPEVFLRQMGHLGHEELRHIRRGAHDVTIVGRGKQHTAAQFQGRLELRCLGLPHPILAHEFGDTGPGQAR